MTDRQQSDIAFLEIAQQRLAQHYDRMNKLEAMARSIQAGQPELRDAEEIKDAERQIRIIGFEMKQLRESYVPQTKEAIAELENEVSSQQAQKGADK